MLSLPTIFSVSHAGARIMILSSVFRLPALVTLLATLSGCATQAVAPLPEAQGPFNYAPDANSALTTYTVTRPPGARGTLPAVLLIHGGGWQKGEPAQMERFVPSILQAGWAAINVGYRLAPDSIWPAQRDDMQAVFADINRRAPALGIDPQRIAVLGYSAGAHLGLVIGTTPNPRVARPVALVLGAGPYDLREYTDSPLVRTFLGGPPTSVGPEIYADASPLVNVGTQTPPTYLWHGTWDLTVSIEQSRTLARELEKAQVRHALTERFGRGHITNFLVDDDEWAQMQAFLKPYLEPGSR